jgi:hypothetical protein
MSEHLGRNERSLTEDSKWVMSALEADQLSAAKAKHYPRRQLKRSETLLFWALRVYLLLMIGIVVYQVWTAAR